MLSYPTLRKVSLSRWGNPGSGDRNPSPRVSLCHLKELKLAGDPQNVFGLLHRLDPPTHVGNLEIVLDCEVGDISHIGPYLRDYLQHRGKSQNGLGLFLSFEDCIGRIHIGDVGGIDFSAPSPGRMDTFVVIILDFLPVHPKEIFTNLIAHIPREEIVYFRAYGEPVAMENISARFPNLGGLHLERTPLPAAFPKSDLGRGGEIFPSLRYVLLDWVAADDGDWSPLMTFLYRRASFGDLLDTLVLVGSYHLSPSVLQSLGKVVKRLRH